MKRKIFGVLFALALVVGFSLMAVPAGAIGTTVPDRVTAITRTADRLVAMQSTDSLGLKDPADFGWDGIITDLTQHSDAGSGHNTYGVTALGLLDAYAETGNTGYYDAAKLAADFLKDILYVDTQDGVWTTAGSTTDGAWWVGITYGGCSYDGGYSFDYQFLERFEDVYLAKEGSAGGYDTCAETCWAWQKANVSGGATTTDYYSTAALWYAEMSHPARGKTVGEIWWQGADYGMAAKMMGDTTWESDMAAEIHSHLGDLDGSSTLWSRFIGWGDAIALFQAVDSTTYATDITTLIDYLSDDQNTDGSWGEIGGNPEGKAQDTGYVIIGLAAVGSAETLDLARQGADWLCTNQGYNSIVGGWNQASESKEYSETDSEALQGLYDVAATVTNSSSAKTYYSIQAAINAASPGDTINVAAGTYSENLTITKVLTLKGEGKDLVTLNPTTTAYAIGVSGGGSNVTIENLTISAGSATNFLVHVSHVSNFCIQNVRVVGAGKTVEPGGLPLGGIDLNTVTTATILNVEVQDVSRNGLALKNSTNVTIESANIHDTGVSVGWAGVAVYTEVGTTSSATFAGTSTITNTPMGIYVEDYPGATVNLSLSSGITLSGQTMAPIVRLGSGTVPSLEATGTTASFAEGLGLIARLTAPGSTSPYNLGASFFYTVNDALVAAVDDGHYLPNTAVPRDVIPYTVVYDLNLDEFFVGPGMNIQAAINAASDDDTVNVAAGTYGPFTVDTKTGLTIQSSGAVIVQGSQSVATAYTNRDCVVFVKDSTGIVLDGLDIQGQGLGTINTKNYGVIYEASSGEIKDCTVSPNTSGNMNSTAIGIWDDSDVIIDPCTIENFGRIGVFIYNGCTVEVLDSTIEGQVYSGEGEVCYGIEIEGAFDDDSPGTGSQVTITGNEIFNCDNTFATGPTWDSGGVYINGWLEYYDEEDSTVIMENNDIHNNYIGIIVLKSSLSSAHFNNIYDNRDCGVDSIAAHDASTAVFDAENNWWGTKEGTEIAAMVSDNVDYDPWLGAEVMVVLTQTFAGGEVDGTDEADTWVYITGGTADVSIAKYGSNPGSGFSGDTGKYIDVMIQNLIGVTEIEIRLYYTNAEVSAAGVVESSLALRWWDGANWVVCSDSGVNTTDILTPPPAGVPYSGYMWAKIRHAAPLDPNPTTPNLTQLTGTPFGGSGVAPLAGGGGPPSTLSKVGSVSLLQYIDWQGRTRIKIILRSDDGVLTIIIFSATLVHNAGGNPLESMGIVTLSTPPPPPGYVLVGHAYDCLPGGANFAPKVTMTFAYDPADIPDGVSENDLLMAYWDGDKWVNLPTAINAAANTATAGVEHFTPFALMTYTGLASFSASNLSIQPLEVQPEETVTITLSVANTGDTEGSYSVVLKINGAKEAEKSITVAAGSSESVAFSVTKAEAGSYSVAVDGLTGSFTVVAPAPTTPPTPPAPPEAKPPINWMWIGIIAAVVVVGLIIFFAVRRRAY